MACAPLCRSCTRARQTAHCLDCGHDRIAHRRVDGGVICQACDRRRGSTVGACRGCAYEDRLVAGRCSACRLRERIAALRSEAEPAAEAALAPYPDALA